MKYIDIKRYNFSIIRKFINIGQSSFLKILKLFQYRRNNLKKIYKFIPIKSLNFPKLRKFFDLRDFGVKSLKKINFINHKFLLIHLPLSIVFFTILYFIIPSFYNYDKSTVENVICKTNNFKCKIKGKINYRFYPTPRLKITNLEIRKLDKKNILIVSKDVVIKLSIKNLLAKDQHKFKRIKFEKFNINFNLKNFKNIFNKKMNSLPINFENGKIEFYDENNYVASISKASIKTKYENGFINAQLEGKFLNDKIIVSLINEKIDNKVSSDFTLKMSNLNFISKIKLLNSEKENSEISGNFLVKRDKNKAVGIFDFNNNKLEINKSNIRNAFIDGKMDGKITLSPYFNFDLNLNLNSLNFTKLYNYFLTLEKKEQKNIFKINNIFNGNINLSVDKIYSKNNLVQELESRLKFYNGNIKIEQFLLNLGKYGAVDMLGNINNDKKITNLKFESNVFVDNQKKFLSKFGIYKKKTIPSNFFISGNFNLDNIKTSFYEISDDKKLNSDDTNYIEENFNEVMLEDGFTNLFNFPKFKVFLKSISSEKN